MDGSDRLVGGYLRVGTFSGTFLMDNGDFAQNATCIKSVYDLLSQSFGQGMFAKIIDTVNEDILDSFRVMFVSSSARFCIPDARDMF